MKNYQILLTGAVAVAVDVAVDAAIAVAVDRRVGWGRG